jgi:hypothetical protein
MILINLLPQELRVSEKKQVDLPYKYVTFGVFLIVFGISIYHLLIFLQLRGELRELKKKWAPLAQSSMQADMLERELSSTIMAEFDFYGSFVKPPLETAQVMNLVSDLLPEGLWLVQFQFVRDKKEVQLILNGVSESKGKDPKLVEIQNFANALKDKLEAILSVNVKEDAFDQKQIKIEATVTTSSEKSAADQEPIIQFVTTFKTEGFGIKKS